MATNCGFENGKNYSIRFEWKKNSLHSITDDRPCWGHYDTSEKKLLYCYWNCQNSRKNCPYTYLSDVTHDVRQADILQLCCSLVKSKIEIKSEIVDSWMKSAKQILQQNNLTADKKLRQYCRQRELTAQSWDETDLTSTVEILTDGMCHVFSEGFTTSACYLRETKFDG